MAPNCWISLLLQEANRRSVRALKEISRATSDVTLAGIVGRAERPTLSSM